MPEFSVDGIVLRRWDSGESDRRIAVLTPDRGKIYLTARGARKAGARLSSYTEPGTHARFAVGARRNAYVTQAQPLPGFPELRNDYLRLACALALLETVDAVCPEGLPSPEVYEDCVLGLQTITSGHAAGCLCWTDLRLMVATGHGPDFSCRSTRLSPRDGGAASASAVDAFDVSKHVAIALAKLQELIEPPPNLKPAKDVATAILRFWEAYAERALPARRALISSL